jgi:arylsulfatase
MGPKTGLALLLACAAGLFGCQPKRDPNVLILVIDALRPDHLGCYGYTLATSPAIDALARRGVLFADVTSLSSYTRAAVPSIFASVHPGAHGVLTQGRQVEKLSDEYTTLAEFLKARGYVTAAFAPNPSLHRSFNFNQGFDLYDDDFQIGVRAQDFDTARRINERTLRWFRANRGKPFFAYLHYRDVHAPYVPPPPYDRMFDRPGEGRRLTEAEYKSQPPDLRRPQRFQDLDSYRERYDGEIRYTDDHLARLLATLAQEGFLDHTVIFLR